MNDIFDLIDNEKFNEILEAANKESKEEYNFYGKYITSLGRDIADHVSIINYMVKNKDKYPNHYSYVCEAVQKKLNILLSNRFYMREQWKALSDELQYNLKMEKDT